MSDSEPDRRTDAEREPRSPDGEGVTEGLSNPDLHGAAREVAESADDSEGGDAKKTAGG